MSDFSDDELQEIRNCTWNEQQKRCRVNAENNKYPSLSEEEKVLVREKGLIEAAKAYRSRTKIDIDASFWVCKVFEKTI